MAGQKRIDITDKDLAGFKYFEKLRPLFARLHDVGCVRDQAGNRELHYDEYCTLILLFLFNPIVTSLRGLQQASELQAQGGPGWVALDPTGAAVAGRGSGPR